MLFIYTGMTPLPSHSPPAVLQVRGDTPASSFQCPFMNLLSTSLSSPFLNLPVLPGSFPPTVASSRHSNLAM